MMGIVSVKNLFFNIFKSLFFIFLTLIIIACDSKCKTCKGSSDNCIACKNLEGRNT